MSGSSILGRLLTSVTRATGPAAGVEAAMEAFETALIALDGESAELVAGRESLARCAAALGAVEASARGVIDALAAADPTHAGRLEALAKRGEATSFEARGPFGAVRVDGRSAGALAWLRVSVVAGPAGALPTNARFAAFVDAHAEPAWIADAEGTPLWVNRAWLAAAGAASLEGARDGPLARDVDWRGLAAQAAATGHPRKAVRWTGSERGRRALRVRAFPLDGAAVAVWADDVTEAQAAQEQLARQTAAHEATLDHVSDAIAVFGPDRRLGFHNSAFAALWGLEPAWLAERPSHAELLDRLRQLRRLPETVDYALFKTDELSRHEMLAASPEALWRLPDERTLRVVSEPHPLGGVLILFADITPELRLKTQFNHLIQVQRATLDKLTDAVAVFGADGRLKLHNEAFERFWSINGAQLVRAADFDGVVELCLRRVHDLQFWRDLKGRITDPDPEARAPVQGEVLTADRRIAAHQSRPLPDGATLISFADVTDTRRLEGALRDREAALSQAERLKREFVGSVSYELRTPLTTIMGYAELMEREAEALSPRARGHVAAVRAAATQLTRSINHVLDMAEVDAGEMTLDVGDVALAELLGEAAERWRAEALAAGVSIAANAETDLGVMRGDARRLAQVLDHLTDNAIRHTPPGGSVMLSAERALAEVRLQVSDTGRGIPFHVQAHIFDRFSGQDRGGAGLGLALVKALVELHGGWVALESEPGAGAIFTCHLPEAIEAQQGRPETF